MSRGFIPNRMARGQNPRPQYGQFVPVTNKSFVSSLEEALRRHADYNSDMVYFDENKDVMYNICTNNMGDKSWTILDIKVAKMPVDDNKQSDNTSEILERVDKLDKKVEELYVKYNAKFTDSTVTDVAKDD